jgi:hypothetical protein
MTAKDKGANARDSMKTQQQVGAAQDEKAAGSQEQKAAQPEGGDATHDSPKRHGDKLEHARDAAAGRDKR